MKIDRRGLLAGLLAALVLFQPAQAQNARRAILFSGGVSVPGSVFRAGNVPANIDLNFAAGQYYGCTLASCLSIVRASTKTDLLPSSASGTQFNMFSNNTLAITPTLGLLIEGAATNQLLNSCSGTTYPTQCPGNTGPATQTTGALAASAQTLWVNGSGSAALSNGTATGCTGTATQGSPVTFTPTAGTCTVTVTGSLNAFQLEAGSIGSSLIITTGATATRAFDQVQAAGSLSTTLQLATFSACPQLNGAQNSPNYFALAVSGADYIASPSSSTTMSMNASSSTITATFGSGTSTGVVKACATTNPSGKSIVVNNGTVATNGVALTFTGAPFIGSRGAAATALYGYMTRLPVFNVRLSDSNAKAGTQ